jgi:hypothetical protein
VVGQSLDFRNWGSCSALFEAKASLTKVNRYIASGMMDSSRCKVEMCHRDVTRQG